MISPPCGKVWSSSPPAKSRSRDIAKLQTDGQDMRRRIPALPPAAANTARKPVPPPQPAPQPSTAALPPPPPQPAPQLSAAPLPPRRQNRRCDRQCRCAESVTYWRIARTESCKLRLAASRPAWSVWCAPRRGLMSQAIGTDKADGSDGRRHHRNSRSHPVAVGTLNTERLPRVPRPCTAYGLAWAADGESQVWPGVGGSSRLRAPSSQGSRRLPLSAIGELGNLSTCGRAAHRPCRRAADDPDHVLAGTILVIPLLTLSPLFSTR